MAEPSGTAAEVADPSASPKNPHGMGLQMEDQLADLRKELKDEDPVVRMKIVEGLWPMGKRAKWAAPALEEVLDDEDVRVRSRATLALLAMEKLDPGAEQVTSVLLEALKDASPLVRSQAATALGPKGVEVLTPLEKMLESDEDADVRTAAAAAMASMGSAALPVLSKVLEEDEAESVRVSAAGALTRMGPEAKPAMPALVKALRDKERRVRSASATALAQIGTEAIADLKAALNSDDAGAQSAAAGALARIGADALPALLETLESGNMFAQFEAASALGQMGTEAKEAVPALQKLLEDKDRRVQSAAAGALKKIQEAGK